MSCKLKQIKMYYSQHMLRVHLHICLSLIRSESVFLDIYIFMSSDRALICRLESALGNSKFPYDQGEYHFKNL